MGLGTESPITLPVYTDDIFNPFSPVNKLFLMLRFLYTWLYLNDQPSFDQLIHHGDAYLEWTSAAISA
ncbi:hypothetical protein D3C74_208000 [compost metagenome]